MAESLVPSRTQYLRQLGSFYVTDLLAVGVFLVLTPLLLHHLGNARFGVLAIADSVLGYIGLLNLGLNPALTRFLAGSEATGNRERTVSLLSTSAMLFGVLGVAGGILECTGSGCTSADQEDGPLDRSKRLGDQQDLALAGCRPLDREGSGGDW